MRTDEISSSSSMSSSSNTGAAGGSSRVPVTLRNFFFQDPFFQNAWDDFEKIRVDMMKESQEFWSKVGQESQTMLRNEASSFLGNTPSSAMANLDLDSHLAPMLFPKQWMLPRFLSRDDSEKMFPSDFFNFKREHDQMLRVKDDDTKYEVSLDTHEYRPDEIKVNVVGNTLSVEAKHEEKDEGKFVSRQFSRKYTLPEGCESHRVSSNLSSDGILMVTAPKRQAIKAGGGGGDDRSVPIRHEVL